MMKLIILWLVGISTLQLLGFASSQNALPSPVTQLNAAQFYEMLYDNTTKWFDAIVDVRRQDEWDAGHIENATFMENLALAGTANEVTAPADLIGCEYCNMVVYCRSGARASQALNHLKAAGFKGRLYNGLGVAQWEDAGYNLVNTASRDEACDTVVHDDEESTTPCTCDECYNAYLAYTNGEEGTTNTPITSAEGSTSNGRLKFPRGGLFLLSPLLAAVFAALYVA